MRMLLLGYWYGIRSEQRLCEQTHLNLAYRWFCRLGLEGPVPDHSSFPRTATAAFARAPSSGACLSGLRHQLAPFYSRTGRPSVDPELMTQMLLVGYCTAYDPSGDCAKRPTSI